ncbi:MAG: LLM class flavin-dependent oxidoreductase, partial [Gammaproteobacteria bacterium]
DGWLPLGLVPETVKTYEPWIEAGLAKAGKDHTQFETQAGGAVMITDDVEGALNRLKPGIALYVGGMGHKTKNFHKEMMIRRGFGEAAERIQELYLAKHKREAIDWEDSGITGFTVSGNEEALRLMAELARLNVDPQI